MKNLWFSILIILMSVTFLQGQRFITQLDQNYFVAGPPSSEIEVIASEQECENWCWASCIQMVLNYHGLYVDQKDFVEKIYGDLSCLPANAMQIMHALNGWAPDNRGSYSEIYAQYGVWSGSDIVDQLSRKWPIIVGIDMPNGGGHAYVLTAIYYSVDYYNNPVIDKVVLRDPWPDNPSRQEMSWNEFTERSPQFFKVWVNRV